MKRARAVLSIAAGITLIASCFTHLFVGWPQLQQYLVAPQLSEGVVSGIRTVWIFAGVAMGIFGIIALKGGWHLWHGKASDRSALFCIGLGYLIFGGWTLMASDFDPFFLVFLLPGLALILAATDGGRPSRAASSP